MSAGTVPVPEDDGGDLSPPPGYEYDPSAEEEFADFQRWRRERGSRRGARRTARRDDDDEGEDDQFRTNAGPPPTWDGTSSPFEDYLIRAKIWCSTTKARPRTRGPLLLKALAETPFQDFKYLAKDSSWLNDVNNAEVLLDKMNSPEYYGDDQEEHLLSALSRLTYHLKRQRQETARQFLARWETAERKVKEHKVDLPSVYRGFLLINALGLSEGDIKALLNYTHGSIEPKEIRTWLRKHETKLQANQLGADGQSTKTRTSTTASSTSSAHLMEDAKTGDYKEEPDEVEEMEAFLADLEGSETENYDDIGTLEEAETAEILSVMLKERKKKTFVQSNQLKKEKELSRGYGQRGPAPHGGPVRPGIYRLSISELKKRTRCKGCGKIGHWKRECPDNPANEKAAHFLEVEIEDEEDALFCHYLEALPDPEDVEGRVFEHEPTGYGSDLAGRPSEPSQDYTVPRVFEVMYSESVVVDDACATIDTGCQRTAVGIETLRTMMKHWPEGLKWFKQAENNRFRSVHGISQTTYNAIVPCGLGKKGCYLKPAVFEGEHSKHAPFLISLKFLRHCKAVLHLDEEQPFVYLSRTQAKVPLSFGPSGALRVPLNNFSKDMIKHLCQAQCNLQDQRASEFEVLSLGEEALPAQGPQPSPDFLPLRHRHDGGQQREASTSRAAATTAALGSPLGQHGGEAVDLRSPSPADDAKFVSAGANGGNEDTSTELGRDTAQLPDRGSRGAGHRAEESTSRTRSTAEPTTTSRTRSTIEPTSNDAVHQRSREPTESQLVRANTEPSEPTARTTATGTYGTSCVIKPSQSGPTSQQQRLGDFEHRRVRTGGASHGNDQREAGRSQSTGPDHDQRGPSDLQEYPHVPLRACRRDRGDPQVRPELPEGVPPLLQSAGQAPVPLLCMAGRTAATRRGPPHDSRASPRRREIVTEGTSLPSDSGKMRTPVRDDQLGHEPALCHEALPHLPKDDGAVPPSTGSKDDPRGQQRLRHGPRGLRGLEGGETPTVLGSDQYDEFLNEIEDNGHPLCRRKRRQIREALRKAERRWQNLFSLLNLPALSGCSQFEAIESRFQQAVADRSAKKVQEIIGMSTHECQLLLGEEPIEHPARTVSVAWVGQKHVREQSCQLLEELGRCRPDMLVVVCESDVWNNSEAEDFAQQCQKFHVTAALLLPDVPSGLRDSNSKDQYFRWSVFNHETQAAFEGVCPDGLMKRSMAHRLIGAAAAVLYATTVDQIYQYYLGAVEQTHRETKSVLQRQLHEKITPQGVPRGNLKEICANEDEDMEPAQANGEGPDQEPEGGRLHEPAQADGEVPDQEPEGGPPEQCEEQELPGSRPRTLKQLVRRAHEGLGHPNTDRFIRILKSAKASHEVIEIARNLKCSVRSRFAQTRPQRRAAPPREYGLNEVVGLDTLWLPYINGRKTVALNVIDWSSHFQLIIPVKTANPEAIWIAFQQWIRLFGPPKQVYVDQGPEFKGSFRNRISHEGIHMEPSSLESPFQRGVTERHGKTFKVMLSKAMNEVSCDTHKTWQALVDNIIMMKNRLANRGGFSPIQRVFGYYPRLPGGLMSSDLEDHEAQRPDHLGDRTIEASMAMRKAAAKAFFETDCDQALRNALSAGPRPQIEYHVGQMVYFYRIGHSKKGRKLPDLWCGPARIVLLDLPGTLWLSYQGGIVKASPERVRPASPEEQLTVSGWLAGLTRAREDFEATPKRGYLDLRQDPLPDYQEEVPGEEEDRGDGPHGDDQALEQPPPLRRVRMKMSPLETVTIPPPQDRDEETTGGGSDGGPEPSQSSWEPLPRTRPHEESPDDELPGPPAKKSRTELLEIYHAKLETLMKTRQRKEVRLKELNQHDLECFIRAAEKEIKNNLETQAYEILGPEESNKVRTAKPERIMDSRFVRTAKPLEEPDLDKARAEGLLLAGEHGGPCKAKVRHVMKGFSENGAEELDAATPQVTRDGVIAVTQMIVGQGWRLGFLDFTQAFHSGDPIGRELYAEQPPEGIPGLQRGQLLRLRKTCYGLLDGPMAWFQHLRRVLTQELGYTQSVVDPCIYYLHNEKEKGWKSLEGIISVATDDMLHGGGAEHQEKMEYLNKTYKLGKFQYGEGRFTGKNFKPLPCGGVLIEQDHYVKEKIETISITRVRKSQRYSMCNEKEIGELRSLVGGLAWLAKETRPDLCGRVCLLQQAFPRPRVRDLIQANQLATEAMKYPAGIKVSKIPLERIRISTVTDASWGNAAEPMTGKDPDYWVETQDQWIRYHVRPRRTLFHPGMTDDGPDLHQLNSQRRTYYQCDGQAQLHEDEWAHPNKVKLMETGPWIGKTDNQGSQHS